MFTRQGLDLFRQQVAALGMALIAVKLDADLGDSLIVEALNDGYKICSFLMVGKAFRNGAKTQSWSDSELLETFNRLVDRQKHTTYLKLLQKVTEEAPGMQTILAGMLHLSPPNPKDLEAATVYCHELYLVLSQNN